MSGAFASPEEAALWIEETLSTGSLLYTVSLLKDPRPQESQSPIGLLGQNRWETLHYMFVPDFWGHGYCTEALLSYMPELWKWAPQRDGVDAAVLEGNWASRRVLEKCGFWLEQRTGRVLRNPYIEESEGEDENQEESKQGEKVSAEDLAELRKAVEGLGLISGPAIEPDRVGGAAPDRERMVYYRFKRQYECPDAQSMS
jgi:hypothetical protein